MILVTAEHRRLNAQFGTSPLSMIASITLAEEMIKD